MNEGFTCECLTDTIIIKFVIVIGVTFSDPPHNTSTWCICGHRRLPFLLGLVTRQPPLTTGRLSPGGGQDDHDEKDCGDDHDDDDQRCYIPHQSSEA